ncbi:dipeptidyl aminopeptidase/acylaminoacyl peptidase [Pedobacter sp. CAN_A7]|uniref:S9 family peptidase n=1 Tax=Pedobacter sp. CAN_A7 TaxID=2787722 RepID=UPI0018CAAF20
MRIVLFTLISCSITFFTNLHSLNAQPYRLDAVKSYPFPTSLTTAATGTRMAWAFDEQGKRNIYVAEGPDFKARRLTDYRKDDGQEISSLSISADGKWVVFIRGGDHGSSWNDESPVNVNADPIPPKVQIHAISFDGRKHIEIGEGEKPLISPKSDVLLFIKKGQPWMARIDGSTPATALFSTRGTVSELTWSPDAKAIAFVSNRSDHSFIGVYTHAKAPIKWIAPSFYRDRSPRWSPDGKGLAFIRYAGIGGKPDSILSKKHQPWSIWKADVETGQASSLWKAPQTLAGSPPATNGGTNLHWAAKDRIVFMSTHQGYSQLYSMSIAGGNALLLTPAKAIVEHLVLSPDKQWLYFSTNTGPDKKDIDRRHIARVAVDKANFQVLSPGTNLEWTPQLSGDSQYLSLITSIGQQPPLPAVISLKNLDNFKQHQKVLALAHIPSDYPVSSMVTPEQVIFNAPDGLSIHAQLFAGKGDEQKKPAIIYIHGGPSRQMLLGWNYSEYYANAYAMNQYLASQGFTVLSVNYRMGIGYGQAFQHAKRTGTTGAAEYQDIKAAAIWLSKQKGIDATRIGVYGGSYGGYLTNMALARDPKLFATGVSIHGLGDRTIGDNNSILYPDRFEKAPDAEEAAQVAWTSSPAADIHTWTAPVLLIHGDDDRNVEFGQSIDLYRRLVDKGVEVESLVIVDDTHHWMKYENVMKVNQATVDFFKRKLKPQP